jgi:hypothetical protein
MPDQLARFRARRNAALSIGIAFPATLLMGAVSGFRTGTLSGVFAFVCVAMAAAGSFYAAWVYRCPNCEREPEAKIPMFRPHACAKCGTRLR